MPPLSNPRHEKAARERAKGKSQLDAYKAAGFKGKTRVSAHEILTNPNVVARVAELQAKPAAKLEVTLESLMAEAEAARALAMELGQTSAAVAAIKEKGVLSGKRIERKEMGNPGDFERMSDDELDAFIEERAARASAGISAEGTSH